MRPEACRQASLAQTAEYTSDRQGMMRSAVVVAARWFVELIEASYTGSTSAAEDEKASRSVAAYAVAAADMVSTPQR